jgi:hypothetical protein
MKAVFQDNFLILDDIILTLPPTRRRVVAQIQRVIISELYFDPKIVEPETSRIA